MDVTQTQHKTQSDDQCKQVDVNKHNSENKSQKKQRIYIRDINIIENDSLGIDQSNGNEIGIKEERFKKFKKWLFENAPSLEQMSEPFLAVQYEKLFNDYKREDILSVLLAMHNYVPLKKRNKSAYLTARNWLDRRAKAPPAPATHRAN